MLLTAADREQLRRASESMLRPFDHASAPEYLKHVAKEIRPLLGSFAAICGARDSAGEITLESDDWSPEITRAFANWKLKDQGTERAIVLGSEVISMRRMIGDDFAGYEADPMVRAWYKPNGVHDAVAYLIHWPEDDSLVTIEWHCATFGTPRFGEEGEWILSMLLPSLKAGTRLLYTLGHERHSLAAEMDDLGVPVCVCARDGRIAHLSDGLRRLLAEDGMGGTVLEIVPLVARAVASTAATPAVDMTLLPASSVHRVVDTPFARYWLSAGLATHAMHFGLSDIIVTVSRLPVALPSKSVAARFQLSPREIEVAELLARGARNEAIALALRLSPHTVRRHTERVLSKLGVASRAEVAALLHGVPFVEGRVRTVIGEMA